jgi:hypothetical protein
MSNFNLSRTIYLIKYDIIMRRSKYMQNIMSFFFVLLGLIFLIMSNNSTGSAMHTMSPEQYEPIRQLAITQFMNSMATMVILCFIIYTLVAAAEVFSSPLDTKSHRLSYFLIPTTNAERFASRIGIYFCYLIAFFVIVFAARACSMIFLLFLKGDPAVIGSWNFSLMTHPFINFNNISHVYITFSLLGMLLHFRFICWGAYFGKSAPSSKPPSARLSTHIVMSNLLNLIDDSHVSGKIVETIINIHSAIIILVCLPLGYCIFTKTQLTRPRIFKLFK